MPPLLQRKSNKYYIFWVCVCGLKYPAEIAYAPFWHLWSFRFYSIFPHYLTKSTILEKKVIELSWFSLQLLPKILFILRRNARDIIKKNVYLSSCKVSINLLRLYYICNFLDKFSKNTKISIWRCMHRASFCRVYPTYPNIQIRCTPYKRLLLLME